MVSVVGGGDPVSSGVTEARKPRQQLIYFKNCYTQEFSLGMTIRGCDGSQMSIEGRWRVNIE